VVESPAKKNAAGLSARAGCCGAADTRELAKTAKDESAKEAFILEKKYM
jgi:hypothetical protein